MKKFYLFISVIGVIHFNINAQEVIATSGDFFQNANGSLSWTLGEPVIETFTAGSNVLTQGFQQSRYSSLSIFEIENTDISISIAPNPTSDNIVLNINMFEDIDYGLYDFTGRLLKTSKVYAEETDISMSDLSYSSYFLIIKKGNQIIKTFQIIKQ
jgi:protease II